MAPAKDPQAKPSSVTEIALQLTQRCNLTCSYCYEGDHPRTAPDIEPARTEAAIDWLFAQSGKDVKELGIIFWGGEALLALEALEHAMSYAKSLAVRSNKSVRFSLTTNGTALSDQALKVLADGPVSVMVSFDGSPQAHDTHRCFANGSGSYARIAARVPALLKALPRSVAKITFTAETVSGLAGSVNDLVTMGFQTVTFAPVTESFTDQNGFDVFEQQLEKIGDLWIAAMERDDPLRILPFEWSLQKHLQGACPPCGAGRELVGIDLNGAIYPCQRFFGDPSLRQDFVLGDVASGAFDPRWFARRRPRLGQTEVDYPAVAARDSKAWWTNDKCPACNAACSLKGIPSDVIWAAYNARLMEQSARLHEKMKRKLNLRYRALMARIGPAGTRPEVLV